MNDSKVLSRPVAFAGPLRHLRIDSFKILRKLLESLAVYDPHSEPQAINRHHIRGILPDREEMIVRAEAIETAGERVWLGD